MIPEKNISETKLKPQPIVKLVVIDDDPQVVEAIASALAQPDLEIFIATDAEEGLRLVFSQRAQIAVVDLRMPKLNGIQILEKIIASDPCVDVFLMTGSYSAQDAVEAIKKGACDYLAKPLTGAQIGNAVAKSLDRIRKRRRAFRLESELYTSFEFEGLAGRSSKMLDLFSLIRRVAPHFRTVLLRGETGTGKDLVARALHARSPYSSGPFIVCNCAALVDSLAQSQLFGHVKGAFTGAERDALGFFESANMGTLFLDEIGEMPALLQPKLLRVLQTSEVQRVGSPTVKSVNVRVIAATNRNLRQMVQSGQFREDLYFRITMVQINLPRLADRLEDMPLLQRHFVRCFAAAYGKTIRGLTRRAQDALARRSWPGNVRELENVLGNACMMVESDFIDIADLPGVVPEEDGSGHPPDSTELITLEELGHRHAQRVLRYVDGNKNRAAEILGISRSALYTMLGKIEAVNNPSA
ncbi:MAG TPA: sigma-54 dependent transcriptional regulator [Candidatus Angelobacter sp.]